MLEGFEKNDQYEYRALIGGETRSTVQTSNSYTESCFGWCGGGGGEKRSETAICFARPKAADGRGATLLYEHVR